jgi:dTDP-4-amino-4,6-dideoxygalactose transaminase
LHSSPAGLRYGRSHGSLEVTDSVSERLIRLPIWMGISLEQQERVVDVLSSALTQSQGLGA